MKCTWCDEIMNYSSARSRHENHWGAAVCKRAYLAATETFPENVFDAEGYCQDIIIAPPVKVPEKQNCRAELNDIGDSYYDDIGDSFFMDEDVGKKLQSLYHRGRDRYR